MHPNKSALILDFFAGSGTTADAVMQLNAEDGGSRRWILCTLDEPCNPTSEAAKAGYTTIDEICRERIKRAALKLTANDTTDSTKNTNGMFENHCEPCGKTDVGFKSYYLKTPTIKTLDKIEDFDPAHTLLPEDMLRPFSAKELKADGDASGTETLLATWLLDDGFDFDTNVETLTFGSQAAAYHTGQRLYILDSNWDTASTKDLLNQLGTNRLSLSAIIVYAYSLRFEALTELKTNIKNNLDENHKVEIIVRF